MRGLFALAVVAIISTSPTQAMTCLGKAVSISASGILSTMTYYARPGQESVVYNGLIQESKLLQQHGVQAFQVYRGPGGSGPAAQWQLTSANFAAHDAWLKQVDKILPDTDPFEASVLRMEHRHYVMHDG
jgi:hypothetical protein